MNIIFDIGGVLMQHNMKGCINAFVALMGVDNMSRVLGLLPNGEGVPNSLMDQYECGLIDDNLFIDTILQYSSVNAKREDVIAAWNTMHASIPADYMHQLRLLADQGHHLFVLSNNNGIHYQDIISHYDMSCFEHVFLSHQLHVRKPDKAIYAAVVQYLMDNNLTNMPVVFVDDIEINRSVGESFGWKTYASMPELLKNLAMC